MIRREAEHGRRGRLSGVVDADGDRRGGDRGAADLEYSTVAARRAIFSR